VSLGLLETRSVVAMNFDAVPNGTAPDQALVLRGADPLVHVANDELWYGYAGMGVRAGAHIFIHM